MSALCAPAVHVGGGGPLPLRLDLRQPAISHPHQDPAVSCSVSVRLSRVVAVTAESFDDGRTDVPGGVNGPVERVVLEARDRIGGRLHTADLGGSPVDLGGSWIHMPGGNPMTAFARLAGVG